MHAPEAMSTPLLRRAGPAWTRALAALLLAGLAGCASQPPVAPTAARTAAAPIATTAHPLATRAALDMIGRGGSAVDAAIAAQMVLGLVEPQSSGIGGGTLALHWDAATGSLTSFDGLAAAPQRTTAGLNIDTDGSLLDSDTTRRGGRSAGVPGTLALFEALHRRHGRLPWAMLFTPAIELAEGGFPMPRYLHDVLAAAPPADITAPMHELYFDAGGSLRDIGTPLRNPAYAATLRTLATQGWHGWLQDGAAREIVAVLQQGARPSLITEQDLLAYRVQPREALCGPFLKVTVCTMGPSSFGGVVVLQMLQTVQAALPQGPLYDFDDPEFVHRYLEAGRLAQADRLRHIGDPDHTAVPLPQMIEPAYLQQRARLIDPLHAMAQVPAGEFAPTPRAQVDGAGATADATSQMAIVDGAGNALSVTTTINLNFGSWLMAGGFVINNAMTNFSNAPPPGQTRANQMAPRKRPISSMAPTIVFDERKQPLVVGGSAGGGQIVDYIASSLIEMIANDRTPQQALARGHISTAVAGTVQLEKGTAAAALADALRAKGHRVTVTEMKSGLGFLKRDGAGWIGAADPRRDGQAATLAPP